MRIIKLKGTKKNIDKLIYLLGLIRSNDSNYLNESGINFKLKKIQKNKIDNIIEESGLIKDCIQLEFIKYLKHIINSQQEIINNLKKDNKELTDELNLINEFVQIEYFEFSGKKKIMSVKLK